MKKMAGKKIIFLIGPPNSGKGTQAGRLAEKIGFFRFITSKEGNTYIREHPNDSWTQHQKELYDAGRYYEPKWLIECVQRNRAEEILKEDVPGILFDGSPRTPYEAKELPLILESFVGKGNIFFVVLSIADDEIKKRSEERFVCSQEENHVVSTRFGNFKIGDRCRQCDGVLQKRELDLRIEDRIDEYKKKNIPAIEYARENYPKTFIEIDGSKKPDEVHYDIIKALKNKKVI